MYNSKDILTRLQNGETAETIANELVAALNEANDAFEKEKKAKAEAEKKAAEEATAAAVKAQKVTAMQKILVLLYDYCLEFHCKTNEDIDDLEKAFDSIKSEELVDMIDTSFKLLDSINLSIFEQPKHADAVQAKKTSSNADKAIANFLKNWDLI